MINSDGVIVAPVSIEDVRTVLGETSTDLGTLCQSSAINLWSRYKPVIYESLTTITDAQRKSIGHGIVLPDVATASELSESVIADAAANTWGYATPTGGESSPYRLTDFAIDINYGYYHNAVPPIQIVYPSSGWVFRLGSASVSQFMIDFDLDVSEPTINLQTEDFVSDVLDLNEWRFVAYVYGQTGAYNDPGLFAAENTILVDDTTSEETSHRIYVDLPTTTGSYKLRVCVCMYRVNGNTYELLPIPQSADYDPSNLTLTIIDDAEASGGGISGDNTEAMFGNVSFCSTLNGTYRTAWVCTDNGTGEYAMVSQGSLYVQMNLTNKSGSTSTISRSNFTMELNGTTYSPTTMYNSSKAQVTSVSIENDGSQTVYLFFNGCFTDIGSDWTTSNLNSSWSMDFKRGASSSSMATLFGCDIYAYYGTDGWTSRT